MKKTRPLVIVLATLCLIAISSAGLEAAFRNHVPREDDQLYDADYVSFLIDAAGPVFVSRRIGFARYLVPKAPGSRYVQGEQKLPFAKGPGIQRIVVVGESSALNLGTTLGIYVRQAAPGGGIEVINMGFGGASLEQVENNYLEALRYEPDIIILCFGHNLMMLHPALGPLALRYNSLVRKSHFLSFLIDRRDRPMFVPPALDSRIDALGRFLRNSARLARERRVALMVCTMPSNLKFPPVSDKDERDAGPYWESIDEAAAEHEEKALKSLQGAADVNPVPRWNYQVAQWLFGKGEYDAAAKRFRAARDLDRQHDRAAASVNARIRATGSEEKLVVLDFERMVTALAPHGIPGWESFIDHVHVTAPMVMFEAAASWRECCRMLQRIPPAGRLPSPPWVLTDWREYALVAARMQLPYQNQRSVAVRSLFSDELRLNEREFVPLLNGILADEANFKPSRDPAFSRARLALNAADAFFWAGRSLDAARYIDLAHRSAPRWAEPYVQSGLIAVRGRDAEKARAAFEKALALEPGRRDAALFIERLPR